jgi:hypothetical protein
MRKCAADSMHFKGTCIDNSPESMFFFYLICTCCPRARVRRARRPNVSALERRRNYFIISDDYVIHTLAPKYASEFDGFGVEVFYIKYFVSFLLYTVSAALSFDLSI